MTNILWVSMDTERDPKIGIGKADNILIGDDGVDAEKVLTDDIITLCEGLSFIIKKSLEGNHLTKAKLNDILTSHLDIEFDTDANISID